jgi:hypothetical protein
MRFQFEATTDICTRLGQLRAQLAAHPLAAAAHAEGLGCLLVASGTAPYGTSGRRPGKATSSRPTRPTTRSQSRSRTGPSTPTGPCSTPDTRVLRRDRGPYIPDTDISPIWNPEFFGNMIMVNGNTWPFQTVEQRRHRFRLLNGCQSRFLILDFGDIPGVQVWAIGNEGGFLSAPVNLTDAHDNRLLMGLAERADLIVDFTGVPVGRYVLGNLGPDEPFVGGAPGVDFPAADPTTPPQFLDPPPIAALSPDRDPAAGPARGDVDALRRRPDRGLARTVAGDPNAAPGRWTHDSGATRSPRTRPWARPKCGSSTTRPATPIPSTSTSGPSRSSTARTSSWTRRTRRSGSPRVRAAPARGLGERVQGHRHRLSGPGHPGQGDLRHSGPVRLALPHPRARGQRDDAAYRIRPVQPGQPT